MKNYVVIRSDLIETPQEALDYFAARISGERKLSVGGVDVWIRVASDATHLFSTEDEGPFPPEEKIVRRVKGGRVEVRRFSLERARLMDELFAAVVGFTVSTGGTGQAGREKRLLHGPALPDGRYLRVVLQPEGPHRFACVSAYPVTADVWRMARLDRRAKFPP